MAEIQTHRMLINGALVDADDGYTLESVNPVKGKPWVLIAEAAASDINKPEFDLGQLKNQEC